MTQQEITAKQSEILQWEIDNRTSENRAINAQGNCVYLHEFHGGCAIGRLVTKNRARKLYGSAGVCFHILPVQTQELQKDFLTRLQFLHDIAKHFNSFGLSNQGIKIATAIASQFSLTVNFNKYKQ